MRVLIVEDNWLLAADAQAIVERQGLSAIGSAPDAATAMALATK